MNAVLVVTTVVEYLLIALMLGLSVWSVSIILDRRAKFRSEERDFQPLREMLGGSRDDEARAWCKANPSFVSQGIEEALRPGLTGEQRDRLVSSYLKHRRRDLDSGLAVLATLGSNAPFIGLLGTVLGIIRAFAYLGSQSGSASVMSGVSQALYATALGLLVAIPAVVAYNHFQGRLRRLVQELESLRDLYSSRVG